MKNAHSFGFIPKDGYWGFQLISIRAAIRDFKAGAAPISYCFTLHVLRPKYLSLSQAIALAIVRGF